MSPRVTLIRIRSHDRIQRRSVPISRRTSLHKPASPRRPAFSLLEFLVVIGVLTLLIGLLLPVLDKARRYSRQVSCAATLRDLGAAWVMYTQVYPNSFPPAASLPSAAPAPATELTIMSVLDRCVKVAGVWRCPADDRAYFERFGTSYEYWPGLLIALDPNNATTLAGYAKHHPAQVPVLGDAEAFHPSAGEPDRRWAMYYDGHVDWFKTPG